MLQSWSVPRTEANQATGRNGNLAEATLERAECVQRMLSKKELSFRFPF
ncbi:hypothetical protein RISK_002501 [Rhodopirellula islandica]|uniref:Uncharacterized protein n=1 Tax=Rhodopirellula islandica TaxID=595434 RepID=A0A0J1EK25_RHOIS|nr:hypothetical protein RISK_002501 [Rhodopirellula islandica]